MAKLPSAFNADDHEELGDYSVLPPGEYHVKIKNSDIARNSKDTGDLLKITFEIMEGEFKGRLLFTNINITHNNPTAQEIGEKTLATILKAVGLVSIDDTEEIHGMELMAKIIKKPATANYAEGNEIKNYSAIEGLERPSKPKSFSGGDKPAAKKRKVSFE